MAARRRLEPPGAVRGHNPRCGCHACDAAREALDLRWTWRALTIVWAVASAFVIYAIRQIIALS